MLRLVEITFWAITLAASTESKRTLTFKNNCAESMWIEAFPDTKNPYTYPLYEVPGPLATVKVNSGDTKAIEISNNGWGGVFVPNFGCDGNGENCKIGGSYTTNFDGKAFKYPKNGNTQIRFYFPAPLNSKGYWKYSVYSIDISSGFYTPVTIVPTATAATNCKLVEFSGFACPTNETLVDVGFPSTTLANISLATANTQQCLSPCAYVYGSDGPIYKYDSTSALYATYYKKKNVAYKMTPDNYCCTVGEAQCNLANTEYYKSLQSASGKNATVGPYYNEMTNYCYESLTASYDVTISCPSSNSAPATPPGCG